MYPCEFWNVQWEWEAESPVVCNRSRTGQYLCRRGCDPDWHPYTARTCTIVSGKMLWFLEGRYGFWQDVMVSGKTSWFLARSYGLWFLAGRYGFWQDVMVSGRTLWAQVPSGFCYPSLLCCDWTPRRLCLGRLTCKDTLASYPGGETLLAFSLLLSSP